MMIVKIVRLETDNEGNDTVSTEYHAGEKIRLRNGFVEVDSEGIPLEDFDGLNTDDVEVSVSVLSACLMSENGKIIDTLV